MNPVPLTDTDTLEAFVAGVTGAPRLSLDTEFRRVRTYYSKLCLLQLGARGSFACVDPLALPDLRPVHGLLHGNPLKLLHAGRQDLELLRQATGAAVTPLFDTQVAAALLGLGEQSGYAALVRDLLGVTLDKSHTRADWSRRPLPPEWIVYAIDDVRYLEPLYDLLAERLERQERMEWMAEEMRTLSALVASDEEPADAWRRIGRGAELEIPAQWRLRRLAEWRELRARRRDLPREWVASDEALVEIARIRPANLEALAAIDPVPEGLTRRHGQELLRELDEAESAADGGGEPLWPPMRPLSDVERKHVGTLGKWLTGRAGELGVERTLIATRADLARLVRGEDGGRLMRGWRREIAGRELAQLAQPGT